MSNKTPYEIRLEILEMAKDFLEKQQLAQTQFAQAAFEKTMELGKATSAEWEKYVPAQFSIDDILAKAAQLYSFVGKKD
jgi:hypothetical protein